MDMQTLRLAQTQDNPNCIDNLIALAVGCRRQANCGAAPLTAEDAAIILDRAPAGLRIDEYGNYVAFGPRQNGALRFVRSLNL
ncbi:MAG TPA: hypothetical protein VKS24_24875 [Bradyrhizobium sp.]|nr:hypothetical protein [Bradyrhizobium sp.]